MKKLLLGLLIINNIYADPRGDITFSYTKYLHEKNDQAGQVLSSNFQVQDDGELFGLNYKLDVIGKANHTIKDNSYLNLNELQFNFNGPFLETYRIGYEVFNWSKLESFHPANVINSNYIDGDLESFKKKGELSLILDNEIILGNLRLYYFPFFERNFYPSSKTRIVDGFYPKETSYAKGSEYSDEKSIAQYGLSLSNNMGNLDFFIFGFKHIDRNNTIIGYKDYVVNPLAGNIPTGKLGVVHSEVLDLGISATYFWDVHTFKIEAVYSDFSAENKILNTNGLVEFVDQTKLAIGHEYTHSFDIGIDVTFFLEYQTLFFDKTQTESEAKDLSIFQNDIFVGQRVSFNDIQGTEIKYGIFYDIERSGEMLIFANFERRINEMWKFKSSYRHIGFSQNDKSGLYLLKKDDEFNLALTRYF